MPISDLVQIANEPDRTDSYLDFNGLKQMVMMVPKVEPCRARQSSLLERDQTLYSFRHTGAIKVFEKTGSLLKLQQVMGHSDMKVSLTYLRGSEVKQLDVEDLPVL